MTHRTRLLLAASVTLATLLAGCRADRPTVDAGEPWSTKHLSSATGPSNLATTLNVSTIAAPRTGSIPAAYREAAVDILRQALDSPTAQLRANAIEALELAPGEAETAAARGLVDDNRGVRFVAAMTIGRLRLVDMVHLVEPLLDDSSDSVRASAIFALRQCGRAPNMAPLASMILSDDPEVRANAALVLGEMGMPSAVGMIRESLGRGLRLVSPARVRLVELQMAEALVLLGEVQEIEVIRAALFSPGEQGEVTALACLMCGRLRDGRAVPNLERLAFSEESRGQPTEVRLAAIQALAMIVASPVPPAVPSRELSNGMFQIRAQAALALGEIGDPTLLPVLARHLGDESGIVQVSAARAILQIDARRSR
ncbi:MAG: HEAT repeat domain-containing protein [Phycisphaerales bacterium]|nr:HEAT repeat domain-containing protein [Phycisphaerales bacterium]